MQNDVSLLLNVLPNKLVTWLYANCDPEKIVEIALDLKRPAVVRTLDLSAFESDWEVGPSMLQEIMSNFPSESWKSGNRNGIDGTLHRISAIRDRDNSVIGLTIRVGRIVEQTIELIADILDSGESVLFVAPPAFGKTTLLRQAACYLSMDKRVLIVDTSDEIAGSGLVPHSAVGKARRLKVPHRNLQHETMYEAVANHSPEVLVIDELMTNEEARECRAINQRGVQLLASIHGRNLESVVANTDMNDVIGRIVTVTISDRKADELGLTNKTKEEVKHTATFTKIVEIVAYGKIRVHHSTDASVQAILKQQPLLPETRWIQDGVVLREEEKTGLINNPVLKPDFVAPPKKRKARY